MQKIDFKNKELQIFLLLLSISTASFSVWILSFYPAMMSGDSLSQWLQAQSLVLNDWHPYISTLYIAFFLKIFNNPLAVVIFQVLATSCLFSYIFTYFIFKKVSLKVIIPLYLMFITSIPIGIYSMTLWKDVPFSLAVIGLAFLFGKKYIEKDKAWNNAEIASLFLLSLVATFFRHNGIIYAIFIPLWFILFFKNIEWRYVFFLGFISAVLFFQFIFPKVIGVEKRPYWFTGANLFAYHMSAGVYYHQPWTVMTPKLQSILVQAFVSPDDIRASYNPGSWNALFWNKNIKTEVVNSQIFIDSLRYEFYTKNLLPNFDYIIGDKTIAFLTVTNGLGYDHNIHLNIGNTKFIGLDEKNEFKFKTKPVFRYGNKLLGSFVTSLDNRTSLLGRVIWNAFIPTVLLLFLFIHSLYINKKHFVAYAGIILFQLPFLFIFNIASDWRYFYFFYLSLFTTIPFFLIQLKSEDKKI